MESTTASNRDSEERAAAVKRETEELRATAETEQARMLQQREIAERSAQEASEAKKVAEQQLLEKTSQQAEFQRKTAELAIARAREAITLAAAQRERANAEQKAFNALQQKLKLEHERIAAEQQALAAIEERLESEKRPHADATACARLETEQTLITRAHEEAARNARKAAQDRLAGEKVFLGKSAEQARLQSEAADAVEAKAREAIELARLESARAEQVAHDEAEREAAELAAQRMDARIEAHAAEELRVAAERPALEAARRQKEYAEASAEQAEALKRQCEHGRAEAQAIATDLISRMSGDKEMIDAWTARAKAVLADSPVPVVRDTGIRRPMAALPSRRVLAWRLPPAGIWSPPTWAAFPALHRAIPWSQLHL